MSKPIIIFTKDDLTKMGKLKPLVDLGYGDFKFSLINGYKEAERVLFVENPNLIVLKDRTDLFNTSNKINKPEWYDSLDIEVKNLCTKQINYLFEVLSESVDLEVEKVECELIVLTLLNKWYPVTIKDDLNDIRKKYQKITTLGTLT